MELGNLRKPESEWIHVFNADFERVTILDTYSSLSWEEAFRGQGLFSLITSDSQQCMHALQEDNLIWKNGKLVSMIIKKIERNTDDKLITCTGYTALSKLSQRVVHPKVSIYNAEQGIKETVTNNNRGLRVHVEENQGYGEIFETQISGGTVLEGIEKIAAQTDMGYRMNFDPQNKRHVFSLYKGNDFTSGEKTVVFKEEFENLIGLMISKDTRIFKNVAYVAGAGEGAERKHAIVGDAQGENRYELWVDARDLAQEKDMTADRYMQLLRARGIEKLNECIKIETFSAVIQPDEWGDRFYLGDKVICKSDKYGVQLETRIMHYKEVTDRNMTTLSLTLGNPEITLMDKVVLGL